MGKERSAVIRRNGLTWGAGTPGVKPAQAVKQSRSRMAPAVLKVSEVLLDRCSEVIAAVIEEPYCCVGQSELRLLVAVHRELCLALELSPEYAFRDGAAVMLNGGSLVKLPLRPEVVNERQAH